MFSRNLVLRFKDIEYSNRMIPRMWFYPAENQRYVKTVTLEDAIRSVEDTGYALYFERDFAIEAHPPEGSHILMPTGYGPLMVDLDLFYPNTVHTEEFSRLQEVKQLSTADKIYPGASHRRWNHSILTGFWSYRAAQILGFDEYTSKTIGLFGVVHDLNHMPYGHAADSVYQKYSGEDMDALNLRKIRNVRRQLTEDGINPEDVIDLLTGRDPRHVVVTSPFGTDRGAYLPVDMKYCFGKSANILFDYPLMMEDFVYDAGRLGIKQRSLNQTRNMLLQRVQMYGRVYGYPLKQVGERTVQHLLSGIIDRDIATIGQLTEMNDDLSPVRGQINADPYLSKLFGYLHYRQWPIKLIGLVKVEGSKPDTPRELYKIDLGDVRFEFHQDADNYQTAFVDGETAENLSRISSFDFRSSVEARLRKALGLDYVAFTVFRSKKHFLEEDAFCVNNGNWTSLLDDETFRSMMEREWQNQWHATVAVDEGDHTEAMKKLDNNML